MSDELKKENKLEELSEEELKGVSGGVTIRGSFNGQEYEMTTVSVNPDGPNTPDFDGGKLTKNTYN